MCLRKEFVYSNAQAGGGDTCGCTDPRASNWFMVAAYGCSDAWRNWLIYGQLLSILRVKKVLQSIFWWPFWPRIRIYSRSAPEESCSRVALETFRGQCQDAPNDDKWKQWPAARNKKISRCACIGTSNSRLRTYIHVCWDHGGILLILLVSLEKWGAPVSAK